MPLITTRLSFLGPIHNIWNTVVSLYSLKIASKQRDRAGSFRVISTLVHGVADATLMYLHTLPPRTAPAIKDAIFHVPIIGALGTRIGRRMQTSRAGKVLADTCRVKFSLLARLAVSHCGKPHARQYADDSDDTSNSMRLNAFTIFPFLWFVNFWPL